jgi:lipopolysaccharide/colanic/teichoic acid biosynthesis glycosyltransferase
MIKFRSLVVDAHARLAELRERNEGSGVLFTMRANPRMTRVGATPTTPGAGCRSGPA